MGNSQDSNKAQQKGVKAMYEAINEKIDVVAIFGKAFREVRPFKFRWHSRDYTISEIGYKHMEKQGRDTIYVFSCTDGSAFFELGFNASEVSWLLQKVGDEETS